MPEGDTIFRAARRMNLALAGQRVQRFDSMIPRLTRVDEDSPIAGRTISRVFSAGKHLLIEFSGELLLRTHLRMNGSWHLYRPGERWRRSAGDMRIVIETPSWVAVGFSIPVAELLSPARAEAVLAVLGPDLLAGDFDPLEAARSIQQRGGSEVADALLDQSAIAGIGNVFKSEVLFEGGINPFRRVDSLAAGQIARLVAIAKRMLTSNVTPEARQEPFGGARRTTGRLNPRERLWVYGRRDEPCRRCGTSIECARQGKDARLTFWCPRCQAS